MGAMGLVVSIFSFESHGMMRALNIAATGMAAQETNVSTISNNIANVNTNAFKKGRVEFEDLYYQTIQEAGGRSSANTKYNVGIQIGSGVKTAAVRKDFSKGNPIITNNTFDLMIRGEGFFGIQMPNGEIRFTRDGSFNVNSQGNLVTSSGYPIAPGITLPPGIKSVNISKNGNVDAYLPNQLEPTNVGTIPVFTFINPAGLTSAGGNLLAATSSSGAPIQNIAGENASGAVLQGTLESSNVSIMNEMTTLIKAQRAFEMNSKVMGIADQMLQTVNNVR